MRGIDPGTFANVSNALPFELHPLDWLVTTIVYKYATYVKVKKISSSFKKRKISSCCQEQNIAHIYYLSYI